MPRLILPKRALTGVLLLAAVVCAAPSRLRAQDAVIVVVSAANPVAEIGRDEVMKLFLKTISKFPSGTPAAPVNNRSAAGAFAKEVLRRPGSAVDSYWQQRIFSGKDVPPPEKGSDAEVLAFVRANPEAIGYVTAGTALTPGVKAVKVN